MKKLAFPSARWDIVVEVYNQKTKVTLEALYENIPVLGTG